MLRGGKAVLFTGNSRPDGFQDANVVVQSLPDGPRKVLVRGAYFGRYLPSGHLVYVHDGKLFAAPFDLERLELTGPAVPALEGADGEHAGRGGGDQRVRCRNSRLSAGAAEPTRRTNYLAARIDWMDRDGETTPLRTTLVRWLNPRFSPDGRRLAFDIFDGTQHDVWTYDWSRDAHVAPDVRPGRGADPVWTPDGAGSSSGPRVGQRRNLYWQRVDATGEAQRLTDAERLHVAGSWHPTERHWRSRKTTRKPRRPRSCCCGSTETRRRAGGPRNRPAS